MLPEPNGAVLVVAVVPKGGVGGGVVGVPARGLTAGDCVHVEDGVDLVGGAEVDDAVEVFEAGLLEDAGVHVVFEMAIVERQAQGVEAEGFEEFRIRLREEVVQEAVEEEVGFALA